MAAWKYDAGMPYAQKKHGWSKRYAGVRPMSGLGRVARCPSGIDGATAEAILNDGFPWPPNGWPAAVYAVHDGVPYETRPTLPGVSFHGFPILPERWSKLPAFVRAELEHRAASVGQDLAEWLGHWKDRSE